MGKFEEDIVRQMLGEEDCPFATAGRAEIEPLARERTKVIMSTLGVGTAYPRHAPKIVAARRKVLAEVGEVPLEYRMEFVTATGNVPVCRRGRNRDCRAHIDIYWLNVLLASREGGFMERHIT